MPMLILSPGWWLLLGLWFAVVYMCVVIVWAEYVMVYFLIIGVCKLAQQLNRKVVHHGHAGSPRAGR